MIEIVTVQNVTYGVECIQKNGSGKYEYIFYKDGKFYRRFTTVHNPTGYMKVDAWYKELRRLVAYCDIYSYAKEHDLPFKACDHKSTDNIIDKYTHDYCELLEDDIIIDEDNIRHLEDIIITYNKETNNYEIRSKYSNKDTKPQLIFNKDFILDDCWVLNDIQSNMMKNHKDEIKTLKKNFKEDLKVVSKKY